MASHCEDREAVRAVIASVAHHIDHRRWGELRALYAADVDTDYTSLFGGSPARQAGDALVNGWRAALDAVTTQHLLGPIEVAIAGSAATARCHVRALHHAPRAPGGEQWEVLGHDVFELVPDPTGWKIARMTLETILQTGNPNLLTEAARG